MCRASRAQLVSTLLPVAALQKRVARGQCNASPLTSTAGGKRKPLPQVPPCRPHATGRVRTRWRSFLALKPSPAVHAPTTARFRNRNEAVRGKSAVTTLHEGKRWSNGLSIAASRDLLKPLKGQHPGAPAFDRQVDAMQMILGPPSGTYPRHPSAHRRPKNRHKHLWEERPCKSSHRSQICVRPAGCHTDTQQNATQGATLRRLLSAPAGWRQGRGAQSPPTAEVITAPR